MITIDFGGDKDSAEFIYNTVVVLSLFHDSMYVKFMCS